VSRIDSHAPIVETDHASHLWASEEETRAWASRLAQQPALRNAFIALQGELGAGKTTLVRHLLRALGVSGRIKSPSYAVVEPYQVPGLAIWHFDFYRFNDPREWEDAGFRELFASPGLKLAEWPENAQGALPVPDLVIVLRLADEPSRRADMAAHSTTGRALLGVR